MKARPWLIALFALLPGPASAHLVSTRFGELYSGVLHPLTSLSYLIPWLAVGLLSGLQSAQRGRWALLVFPAAVLLSAVASGSFAPLAGVELIVAGSLLLLGGLVAAGAKLPSMAFLCVVALVGAIHGYANAAEGLTGARQFLYALGVALAAYLLITLAAGSAHALVDRHGWGRVAVRAAGSWMAAAGAMYGALLLLTG